MIHVLNDNGYGITTQIAKSLFSIQGLGLKILSIRKGPSDGWGFVVL
ncbi:uncharacterized protein METZ01_LOCUS146970 [marine metagenome]|uniref:Uncharacterized protein n=1 Tax=marine metagenome TaxID=408172 RepID=A0A381ZXY0_9ZZZZ